MKTYFRSIYFLAILIITLPFQASSQTERIPFFLGLNPSVTIEPFYEKGELDINILPLVFQRKMTYRIDFRLTSILNLGIRNEGSKISHFGIESAFPIFLKKKDNKTDCSSGFFISPIISLTRNRIEEHNNLGLWIEPGYHLLFENKIAMSFGLQLGSTYFVYDEGQTKWGNHFGVKIIIGRWF